MNDGGVVIFVPLQEEVGYVYDALLELNNTGDGETVVFHQEFDKSLPEFSFRLLLGTRERVKVSVNVIGDMGNLRTSTSIVPALIKNRPNTAYLLGLAGSLSPEEFGLGDVAISHRAKLYYPDKVKNLNHGSDDKLNIDPSKLTQSNSFFRYRRDVSGIGFGSGLIGDYLEHVRANGSPKLIPVLKSEFAQLDEVQENSAPGVNSATIFGSDMVIDCQDYIDFIKRKNRDLDNDYYKQRAGSNAEKLYEQKKRNPWFNSEIDVVDMESFGFFKMIESLQRTNVHVDHAITVRGVSDLASKKQTLDEQTDRVDDPNSGNSVRKIAVKNAASVCIDMIKWQQANAIYRNS